MSIQAIPVFKAYSGTPGGGESGDIVWPDVTLTGSVIKRWVDSYAGQDYAVYACWHETSSAVFTVGTAVTADFYMISPGETGKPGNGSGCGQGGGAGVPSSWSNVQLTPGNYTVTVSGTQTAVSGAIGTLQSTTPNGGYAVGSTYQLFGDAAHEYGTVTEGVGATAATPGRGKTGCTFLPVKAPDTVYGYNSTKIYMMAASSGVAAGGNGGARTDYCATYLGSLVNAGTGALGMWLMRIAI